MEIAGPGAVGQWRSYSVASAPAAMEGPEFVIKVIDGGAFPGQLDMLKMGTRPRFGVHSVVVTCGKKTAQFYWWRPAPASRRSWGTRPSAGTSASSLSSMGLW